jgi:hypothetical protein
VIKTLYPVIFNTILLASPSPSDSPPFTIAALRTVYSRVAGTKVADTTDNSFSEALRADPVELTAGILAGSFFSGSTPEVCSIISMKMRLNNNGVSNGFFKIV